MYESSKVNCTSFFALNVQVLEEKFLRKSCSISEKLTQIYFKKHHFCSYKICMSHQRSIVHHFFPLNVQVLQEKFLNEKLFH